MPHPVICEKEGCGRLARPLYWRPVVRGDTRMAAAPYLVCPTHGVQPRTLKEKN